MTQRFTTADKYRKLYPSKQWRTLRGTTLTRDHYRCRRCSISLTSGKSQPTSAVVHHKKPHKGNLTLFYDPSNMEAICWSCHLGTIQSEECWDMTPSLVLMVDPFTTNIQRPKVNDRHRGLLQSDGHFLIQPASYLQCGRATHPANLSFRFV